MAPFRTTTRHPFALIALVLLFGTLPACALRSRSTVADGAAAPPMSELWAEAEVSRDLFAGPGGAGDAPNAQTEFRFVSKDTTGKSPGYDVRDPQGRLSSVKLGPEAQSEVVVSRLLWAAGYFQPATYYLPGWKLAGSPDPQAQPGGRFRLESEGEESVGPWSWGENPFVGTTPLRGLFVLMVMVNNWDLKTQQNKVYEISGTGAVPLRRYVVRDLGASLGSTRWFFPGSKSNVEDFERERFIHSVNHGRVRFSLPRRLARAAPQTRCDAR